MQLPFKNMFKRTATAQSAEKDNPVRAALFEEEATNQLVRMLTRMPDFDEVLKQAGIKRDKLRVLIYDDEIAQAVETRLDALLATPMRLEPGEGNEAELITEILEPVIRDAVTGAFQARLFGYSVLEAVYMYREDGKIGLRFAGEKPFEWFEPKSDGALMYFPDNGAGGTTGIACDQRFKFFLTRSRPTYRQPYGEALLSRLYWPWFFRTNGWKFWAKFLERFGAPLLVGKSTDTRAMVSALLLAHSQAVIGVDREDSVEAIGASSNTGQAFDSFEAAAIRRIQKVVLGQTLTSGTDNGSGNRALGNVHNTVRMDKRDSDIQLVQPTIQRLVNAICELNGFGKHEVVFADDTGLEETRAARDKDLFAIGVRFTSEYVQDNYDLREGDFTLSSEASGAGTTPPPPTDGGAANPSKPGDAQPASSTGSSSTKAAQSPPSLFTFASSGKKFTAQQEVVEGVADKSQLQAGGPLGNAVRSAVLAASTSEDLEDRLFALIGDQVSREDFRLVVERAMYAADVLGYVHGEGKV
jgi:phage gp29-like protein